MASVRLYLDQIERLRESGDGAKVIAHALKRYRSGIIKIGRNTSRKARKQVLQRKTGIYSLSSKSSVTSALLRAILDAYFAAPGLTPDEKARLKAEQAKLDRYINATLDAISVAAKKTI